MVHTFSKVLLGVFFVPALVSAAASSSGSSPLVTIAAMFKGHIEMYTTAAGDRKIDAVNDFKEAVSEAPDFYTHLVRTNSGIKNNFNELLAKVADREKHTPSFMPTLLKCGAHPFETFKLRNGKDSLPIKYTLDRLKKREGLEVALKHLKYMVRAVDASEHKTLYDADCRKHIRAVMGSLGDDLTLEDYMVYGFDLLEIGHYMGANLEGMRKSVFPFLRKSVSSQEDYDRVQKVRTESSKFLKCMLSCLVYEFLYSVAQSMRGSEVIDLDEYTRDGGVKWIESASSKEFHKINAERYRSRLNAQANQVVSEISAAIKAASE